MSEYHAFISYSSAHRAFAEALKATLEREDVLGKKVFLDAEGIGVGRPWNPELEAALRASQYLVILAAPEAMASPWVNVEREAFVGPGGQALRDGSVLVAMLVNTPLPPFLETCQTADFTDPVRYRAELTRLVAALRGRPKDADRVKLPDDLVRPPLPVALDAELREALVEALVPLVSVKSCCTSLSQGLGQKPRWLDTYPTPRLRGSAALACAGKTKPNPRDAALLLIDLVEDLVDDVDDLIALRPRLEAWTPPGTPPSGPEAVYREHLRAAHCRLVPFFPDAAGKTLDAVHVHIDIQRAERLDKPDRGKPSSTSTTLRGLLSLPVDEETGTTGRWLIQGEPGAGKSTIARFLAFELGGEPGGPLPIYVSLPRLAAARAKGDDLLTLAQQNVTASVGKRADTEGVASLLSQGLDDAGKVWLLLDGLDEVPPDRLDDLRDHLDHLCDLYPLARIVVLSRTIDGLYLSARFRPARLQHLSDTAKQRLLKNWLDEHADAAWRIIQERESLRLLSNNPLWLTILASLALADDARELPKNRIELYRAAVQHALLRTHKEGAHQRKLTAPIKEARRALAELALALQTSETPSWVREALDAPLEQARAEVEKDGRWPWPTDEAFLKDVSDLLGMHQGVGEPYSFLHRQLREFLSAEAMARRGRGACVEAVSELEEDDLPRWSEVFGLLTGMFDRPAEFLTSLREVSPRLARMALADAEGLTAREKVSSLIVEVVDDDDDGDDDPWDDLWRIASSIGVEDDTGRDVLADALWNEVSAERSTTQLALLHHALERIRRCPDRVEFFRRCQRPVDQAPDIDWADVPAGDFVMGAEKSPWDDERPTHRVSVSGFRLAKTIVTRGQYRRFDPSHESTKWELGDSEVDDDLPVTEVNWWEARLFSFWVGGRLPTEAEWEHACRAGTTGEYWSGSSEEDLERVGWYSRNADKRPHAVGLKPANSFGLHDMHGNVDEWCADRWHDNYEGAPDDGSSWEEGPSEYRVSRGGSFGDTAVNARSAYRYWGGPAARWSSLGFRVASSSQREIDGVDRSNPAIPPQCT